MGMTAQMAKMVVREHVYKPITGELLLCGRQSIFLTPEEALKIVADEGVLRQGVKIEIDNQTRSSGGNGWILDASFFDLFTDAKFNAVDVSAYEGANIVHDMCTPVPGELHGRFSFIFNGSCMDNLSNPGAFLVNTSRMLAPGGVVIHIEHGSRARGAYLMYSPDYFFDFYANNRYADCKVYMAVHEGNHRYQPWNIFQWYPRDGDGLQISNMKTTAGVMVLVVAEKAVDSTDDNFPIQVHYRPKEKHGVYLDSARRFLDSHRPILKGSGKCRSVDVSNFPVFCGAL